MVAIKAAGAGRAATKIVGMGNDHHSLGNLVCRINIGNKLLRVGDGHGVTAVIITALYKGRSLGQIVSKYLAIRHLQAAQQGCALFEGKGTAVKSDRRALGVSVRHTAHDTDIFLYRHTSAVYHNGGFVGRSGGSLKKISVFQGNIAAVYGQRNITLFTIGNISTPSVTAKVNCDRAVGDDNIFIYLPRKGYRTADGCGGVNGALQQSIALSVICCRMNRTAYANLVFALIGMCNIVYRIFAFTCRRVGQTVAVGGIGISVIFRAVSFPASANQAVYVCTDVLISCRCMCNTGFCCTAKVAGPVVGIVCYVCV